MEVDRCRTHGPVFGGVEPLVVRQADLEALRGGHHGQPLPEVGALLDLGPLDVEASPCPTM